MSRSEATREMSVRPGMIDMVAGVVRACVVPYPLVSFHVDVRGVRVTIAIIKMSLRARCGRRRGMFDRRGTVRRNVSSPNLGLLLSERRNRQKHTCSEYFLQFSLQSYVYNADLSR